MNITAGMMVRNEEARIRACLESLPALVDQIVLEDTGSTDGTLDIILDFAARAPVPVTLHEHPWLDDFSAHRNRVQAHCVDRGADWILWFDGDEVLIDPGNIREVAEETDRDALGCHLEAMVDGGRRDTHEQVRVYRPDRCHWRFPIHNQLVFKTAIRTTGHIRTFYVGTIEQKAARSIPMLEKFHAEHPYEVHGPFFLAKTYRALGDLERTRHWCEVTKGIAPNDKRVAVHWVWLYQAVSVLEGMDAAAVIAEEAIQRHPEFGELYHCRIAADVLRWAHFTQAKGEYIFQSHLTEQFLKNLPEAGRLLGLPLTFETKGKTDADHAGDREDRG